MVKFTLNANPREQQVQEKKEAVKKVATRRRCSFRKVQPKRKEREVSGREIKMDEEAMNKGELGWHVAKA